MKCLDRVAAAPRTGRGAGILCDYEEGIPMKTLIATMVSALFVTGAYAQASAPAAAPAPHAGHAARAAQPQSATDRVEARIAQLHAELQITPEQEGAWGDVAQAMRDEAKQMDSLIEERQNQQDMMTAVDDLGNYARIAQAHADGVKQMLSVFTPLYNSMSDQQKKIADQVFHPHPRPTATQHHGAKVPSTKAAAPAAASSQ
jgi:periplasmic protein CpxP/Spy